MARTIYPVGSKFMYVDKNDSGELIAITDEAGKPAERMAVNELNIACTCSFKDETGKPVQATLLTGINDVTFVTQHNPTYRWYFINGQWYYIISNP